MWATVEGSANSRAWPASTPRWSGSAEDHSPAKRSIATCGDGPTRT